MPQLLPSVEAVPCRVSAAAPLHSCLPAPCSTSVSVCKARRIDGSSRGMLCRLYASGRCKASPIPSPFHPGEGMYAMRAAQYIQRRAGQMAKAGAG